MFLESALEVFMILFFLALIILFWLLRYFKRKKIKLLVENGQFIKSYFDKNKDLYQTEYLPNKAKPLNRLNDQAFFTSSFCIYADGIKVYRINYKDIYWVYGEVCNNKNVGEIVMIKTITGNHRIYVKKQNPYVLFFHNLGIPCGYDDEVKEKAMAYKIKLKEIKHDKK